MAASTFAIASESVDTTTIGSVNVPVGAPASSFNRSLYRCNDCLLTPPATGVVAVALATWPLYSCNDCLLIPPPATVAAAAGALRFAGSP